MIQRLDSASMILRLDSAMDDIETGLGEGGLSKG